MFALQSSPPAGIASFLAFLDLHGLDRSYLEAYVERVYAVTPADVQATARNLLRAGDMAIVVGGDRAIVEEQLALFGEVTVETFDERWRPPRLVSRPSYRGGASGTGKAGQSLVC